MEPVPLTGAPATRHPPRVRAWDSTVSWRRDPYRFVSTQCRHLETPVFEGRLLRDMYATDPCFREKVFSRALARVSELEQRIIANAASTLQARLASTLLRLSAVYGKDSANSGNELTISQNDLAATLPASREKVNQCLRRLRECKIIDGGQGRIRILNRKALEACANGAFSVK